MKRSVALAGAVVLAAVLPVPRSASAAPAPTPAPSVSSISPSRISTTGGTTVTINGSYLTDAGAVSIGGRAASSVTVVSSSRITAIAPPGPDGAAEVTVTTPAGTSTVGSASTLTYRSPLNINVSRDPVAKASGGPLVLEITGGSLGDDARAFAAERVTVTMNQTTLTPTYVDSGRLKVTVPPTAADDAEFTVLHDSVAGEPATVTLAPVVTSLSPKEDTVIGGKKITIRVAGANNAEAGDFRFGGAVAECTPKGAGSSTYFECVAPPAPEAGPVEVTFTSGSGAPSRFAMASTFIYTD